MLYTKEEWKRFTPEYRKWARKVFKRLSSLIQLFFLLHRLFKLENADG
jgi:hypothetical protein